MPAKDKPLISLLTPPDFEPKSGSHSTVFPRFLKVAEALQNKGLFLSFGLYHHTFRHSRFLPGVAQNKEKHESLQPRRSRPPAIQGAVIARQAGSFEDRCQVFHDGKVHTCYASQLELAENAAPQPTASPGALHAALTALHLPPGTSRLYSLRASRINFVPYQFRPVLKLIQSDRPRLLIADGVGGSY